MIGPGRGLIHKVEICHLYTNRANVVFSKNYTGVDCWDAWHLAPSQLWRCVSSDLQSLSPSTPHRAGSRTRILTILCQSPPRKECDDVICGVEVAVPGARRLLLPTRTMGRARSHGGAGHYSAARDRRVLPLFGGLLRKSRYDNHRKRVKNMF